MPFVKIEDLTGLSKPLTRLVEVIAEGVGALSRPLLIKWNAKAKAEEIRLISDALKVQPLPVVYKDGAVEIWQRPEDKTLVLDVPPIETRIAKRIEYQERKSQTNIEAITSQAALELVHVADVPDSKPEPDWISRFFGAAQDITSEEMQNLWGRILAGEIKRPGSYSLRTLDFVRNLTKSEADVFEKLGRLSFVIGDSAFLPVHDKRWLQTKKGIVQAELFVLGELGAMFPTELVYSAFKNESAKQQLPLIFGDYLLIVSKGAITPELALPVWKFTAVGYQLLSLVVRPEDMEYLHFVGMFFVQHGAAQVLIAKIRERLADGGVRYDAVAEVSVETAAASALP